MKIGVSRKEAAQALFKHLEDTLSASSYRDLGNSLNSDASRLSKLRNGKLPFNVNDLIVIADLLDDEVWDLIKRFGVGSDYITLDDMNKVLANDGYVLDRAMNAA